MQNLPYTKTRTEDIIINNLIALKKDLKKEGVDVNIDDFQYEFFTRCEFLSIASDIIYPNEDLPAKFGVYRGYNGGGIHSGLVMTETDHMTPRRRNKAQRLLELFRHYFWQIIKQQDQIDEDITGETKEKWESLTI